MATPRCRRTAAALRHSHTATVAAGSSKHRATSGSHDAAPSTAPGRRRARTTGQAGRVRRADAHEMCGTPSRARAPRTAAAPAAGGAARRGRGRRVGESRPAPRRRRLSPSRRAAGPRPRRPRRHRRRLCGRRGEAELGSRRQRARRLAAWCARKMARAPPRPRRARRAAADPRAWPRAACERTARRAAMRRSKSMTSFQTSGAAARAFGRARRSSSRAAAARAARNASARRACRRPRLRPRNGASAARRSRPRRRGARLLSLLRVSRAWPLTLGSPARAGPSPLALGPWKRRRNRAISRKECRVADFHAHPIERGTAAPRFSGLHVPVDDWIIRSDLVPFGPHVSCSVCSAHSRRCERPRVGIPEQRTAIKVDAVLELGRR